MSFLLRFSKISHNVPPLGEVANFVTVYFPLKIKFLAERKRELTTKFAILPNGCYAFALFLSSPFVVIKLEILHLVAQLFLFLKNYFLWLPFAFHFLIYGIPKKIHFPFLFQADTIFQED